MITSCIAFYPCLDLSATEAFYTQVIGLRTVFASDTVRDLLRQWRILQFCRLWDGEIPHRHLCLSLNCTNRADVDAEYRHLSARCSATEYPCPASQPAGLFLLFGGPKWLYCGISKDRRDFPSLTLPSLKPGILGSTTVSFK